MHKKKKGKKKKKINGIKRKENYEVQKVELNSQVSQVSKHLTHFKFSMK